MKKQIWFVPSHHPKGARFSNISFYDIMQIKKKCTLVYSCRKADINYFVICYQCKGQACTISTTDDDITTNSANQESEINIMMERVISKEIDSLELKCKPVHVEENVNKLKSMIMTHLQHLKILNWYKTSYDI